VLAHLVSAWIIGHHPSVRNHVLARHVQAVRDHVELHEDTLSVRKSGEAEDW